MINAQLIRKHIVNGILKSNSSNTIIRLRLTERYATERQKSRLDLPGVVNRKIDAALLDKSAGNTSSIRAAKNKIMLNHRPDT